MDEVPELTPEQMAEHIRQLKVSDLLVTNMAVIAQLGYAKLEPSSRDLVEARVAIEALKALTGVLDGAVEPQRIKDYQQVLANLQLAYASAAGEAEKEGTSPES